MLPLATPSFTSRVNDPASVDAAILSRFSTRAYLPRAVDRSVLQEVLELAAALEAASEHPVAAAIVSHARSRGVPIGVELVYLLGPGNKVAYGVQMGSAVAAFPTLQPTFDAIAGSFKALK